MPKKRLANSHFTLLIIFPLYKDAIIMHSNTNSNPSIITSSFIFSSLNCSPLGKRRKRCETPGKYPDSCQNDDGTLFANEKINPRKVKNIFGQFSPKMRSRYEISQGIDHQREIGQNMVDAKKRRMDFAKGTNSKGMAKEEEEKEEMAQNVERITQMNVSSTSKCTQNEGGGILRIWQNFKAQIRTRDKFTQRTLECQNKEDSDNIGTSKKAKSQKTMATSQLAIIDEEIGEEAAENAIEEEKSVSSKQKNVDKFVIFCVRIHLREGHGLAIRDASGSSDPYVKCQYSAKTIYRSEIVPRELNPNWDEEFAFLIDDPTQELAFKIFDYDRFMKDDFMGMANIQLGTLSLFQKSDFKLPLEDPLGKCPELYLGYLLLSITLTPLTVLQKESFMESAVRGIVTEQRNTKRRTNKASFAILARVNILLVEANLLCPSNTIPMVDHNNSVVGQIPPDTHVKFKLGNEKFKTKSIPRCWQPKWLEQFELHIFDEHFQTLDISVCDNRSIIGRCSIDLTDLEAGRTVEKWYCLEEKAGAIHLLLTISPSMSSSWEALINCEGDREEMVANSNERGTQIGQQISSRYKFWRSFHSLHDIGCLILKVFEAEGLAAADLNGKSDPFCVVELVNLRAQTQTEYKTLNPKWERTFTFFVKDIHEAVELTVFDEDPNKRAEFLGKIAIPLLKIRNGEKRWFNLKNRKLNGPAKGRILIEANLHFNPFKAALRTFKPRESKFVRPAERFKRAKFLANINKLRSIADQIVGLTDLANFCLSWQSYPKSICALIAYIFLVMFVQLWHFPFLILLIFVRSYSHKRLQEHFQNWANLRQKKRSILTMADGSTSSMDDGIELDNNWEDVEEDEDLMENELGGPIDQQKEKWKKSNGAEDLTNKSLKGRIQAVQDTLVLIQSKTDFLLALLDRVKNTFNFAVPFCSILAILVLSIGTIILYIVSLRWILLVWGINKFSKRLRNPNYVDNNELLDFLSRIPSDKEIRDFRNISRIMPSSTTSTAFNQNNCNSPPPIQSSNSPFSNGNLTRKIQ